MRGSKISDDFSEVDSMHSNIIKCMAIMYMRNEHERNIMPQEVLQSMTSPRSGICCKLFVREAVSGLTHYV